MPYNNNSRGRGRNDDFFSKSIKNFIRPRPQTHNNSNETNQQAVGTEATALANLEKNKKLFKYPDPGVFLHRIEYSLLYSILAAPEVYPEGVVREHIQQEEDFIKYIELVPMKVRNHGMEEEIERTSYAQLSALLALAVHNFPPKEQMEGEDTAIESVSQTLCKAVLQSVIRYTEEHDLERKDEIDELMSPVEEYCRKINHKDAMKQVLPLYVGYAATLITANPLPFVAGGLLMSSMGTSKDGGDIIGKRAENMKAICSETVRRSDAETTSLLDEVNDMS